MDLNVKLKMIKSLEENMEQTLCDLGLGKYFSGMTKSTIRKWFCSPTDTSKKIKGKPQTGRKDL